MQGAAPGRVSPSRGPLVFLCLAALAMAPGLVQVFLGPDDHDVAWLLYVAGRVLDGARLYADVIEVNPPLIVALGMPVVLLSRATGISDVLTFELSVLALVVVSLGLCGIVLRQLAPPRETVVVRRGFLVLAAFALCAVPASSNVFAQREHIMLILVLPYLLAAAARAMRVPLRPGTALAVGLLGGVGIALKPFFVLPWVLVEAYLALRVGPRRAWLRREAVVVAAVLACYAAVVVLLTPDYLRLVSLLREVYGDFLPQPYRVMLGGWRALYVALAVMAIVVSRSDDRTRELTRVLVLATAGFMAALLIQGKGWEYHWYPPLASATLLLGIALRGGARGGRTPVRGREALVRSTGIALAGVGLVLMSAKVVRQLQDGLAPPPGSTYMRDLTAPTTRLMREHARGESVAGLSSLPMPMFPAVNQTGVRWGSRFMHLWALSGPYADQARASATLRYHRPDEMGPAERLVYEGVLSDMLREPPRLLFVLTPPHGTLPHPSFDYVAYFSQDPRFARRMAEYEVIERLGDYIVYKRVGGSAVPSNLPAPRS